MLMTVQLWTGVPHYTFETVPKPNESSHENITAVQMGQRFFFVIQGTRKVLGLVMMMASEISSLKGHYFLQAMAGNRQQYLSRESVMWHGLKGQKLPQMFTKDFCKFMEPSGCTGHQPGLALDTSYLLPRVPQGVRNLWSATCLL